MDTWETSWTPGSFGLVGASDAHGVFFLSHLVVFLFANFQNGCASD